VYLELDDCEFEASNDGILVKIPANVWNRIIKVGPRPEPKGTVPDVKEPCRQPWDVFVTDNSKETPKMNTKDKYTVNKLPLDDIVVDSLGCQNLYGIIYADSSILHFSNFAMLQQQSVAAEIRKTLQVACDMGKGSLYLTCSSDANSDFNHVDDLHFRTLAERGELDVLKKNGKPIGYLVREHPMTTLLLKSLNGIT